VHRAVEAHHGFIIVDAAIVDDIDGAQGTKFTVILPRLGASGKKGVAKATPEGERR
jgi:hypothetical protein